MSRGGAPFCRFLTRACATAFAVFGALRTVVAALFLQRFPRANFRFTLKIPPAGPITKSEGFIRLI